MKENKPATQTQNIGDVEIQYLSYEDSGPPILFLHATGFLPWIWHPIAREICGDYRVIAPYFCDHRESDPQKDGLHWGLLAEDLYQLCNSIGLDKPLFVGHSMGATVGAIAEALHGPLFTKMILIEPIFLQQQLYKMEIPVDKHPLASKSIKRRNSWKGADEALDYLRSKPLFKNWDDEMLELYINYGMKKDDQEGLVLACSPAREASIFIGGMKVDPWPLLPKVGCPTLVVEGGASPNRFVIDLKKAVSLIPHAEYEEIKGAGHLVPMEKPEDTVNMIRKYFGNV